MFLHIAEHVFGSSVWFLGVLVALQACKCSTSLPAHMATLTVVASMRSAEPRAAMVRFQLRSHSVYLPAKPVAAAH